MHFQVSCLVCEECDLVVLMLLPKQAGLMKKYVGSQRVVCAKGPLYQMHAAC